MPTPQWWKQYYAAEREALGDKYLESLVLRAPRVTVPEHGALIFPHTRLAVSGHLTASAARAVVHSGRDTVLAIGVLHGVPRQPELRGIHGPAQAGSTAPRGKDIWRDEFSLDNFDALLGVAAHILAKPKPRLIARYPFQTGDDPASLAGYVEIRQLLAGGAALVATADMIHHGAGYNTPPSDQLAMNDDAIRWAEATIQTMLHSLANHDYTSFVTLSQSARSDFRDAGPVVAALLGDQKLAFALHDLLLVDYSGVLGVPAPTWVVAALVGMTSNE